VAGVAAIVALLSCKEIQVTAVDVSTVTVSAPTTRLDVGQSAQFIARVEDRAGRQLHREVVWSSSAQTVASVSVDGTVTGRSNGTAMITAVVEGRSDAVEITVGDEPVASVEVQPTLASLQVGETLQLRAIPRAVDGTELTGRPVTWASSDAGVAEVGVNGLVTARAVGSATVIATAEGMRGQAEISVNASLMTVSSVSIDPVSASVAAGDSVRLTATARASDGSVIAGRQAEWTSDNTVVAGVGANGVVHGNTIGRATITGTIDGVSGNASVEVTQAVATSLTVSPPSVTVTIGGTVQLAATVHASDGSVMTGLPITWQTDDPVVANVTSVGLVTGKAVGTATVTASARGVSGTAMVFVVIQPVARLSITPQTPGVLVGDSVLLDSNPIDSNGIPLSGRLITWSTGDASIASAAATNPNRQQAWIHGVSAGATYVYAMSGIRRDSTLVTVLPRANLVVTKTAAITQARAGETIAFTLTVSNAGPSAAAGVVLSDTLPANAKFIDATGAPSQSGNALEWPAIASLAAGDSRSFTVNLEAPSTGEVINIGAAVSATPEVDPTNNRAIATVTVAAPDLSVMKTASAAIVQAGDIITYTIDVLNHGPGPATAITVADTLPANATFLDAIPAQTPAGNILTWQVPSLDENASAQFTIRVTAPANGAVRNVATALASSGEAVPADNVSEVTVGVNALADLDVMKTASVATIDALGTIDYFITVKNIGLSAAADVVVTDALPANALFVDASGTPTIGGGMLTWTAVSIAPADSVRYTVRVTAPEKGTVTNAASATTTTGEASQANNSDTAPTTVNGANLRVVNAGPAQAAPGDPVTWTIQATNNGPGRADDVVISDMLPAGVTFVSATGGITPDANGVLTWPALASLANGASTGTYTVQVTAGSTGPMVNTAAVDAVTSDPDLSDNLAVVTTALPVADLAIAKAGSSAQVNPGGTVTYTIDVINNGPDGATGVVVTDVLPSGMTFVSATTGGTESGGTVTWPAADLPNGQSLSYSVTVNVPAVPGTYTNTASVSSATTDPLKADNSDTASTEVTQADLTVTKVYSGPANPTTADTLVFTITVDNAGPSAASDVVVTDTLDANATFIDASQAASPSGGIVAWNVQSIAASSQETFTIRMLGPAAGGDVRNAAAAVSSTFDPQPGDNHDSATASTTPGADVAVTVGASADPVDAGDTIVYTIDVQNLGPSDATGVVVTDALQSAAGFVDATGGITPSGPSGNVLTWPAVDLAAGASQGYTVRFVAGAKGTIDNTATVAATTFDPVASNNSSTTTTIVNPANIDVSILAPTSVSFGSQLTYRVRVVNEGPGTALDVTLEAPPATNATFAGNSDGNYDVATGVVSISTASLTAGDSLVFEITVDPDGNGDIVMSASSSTSADDPDLSNNSFAATTTLSISAADLGVTVTANPAAALVGDVIEYTITVVNNGPGEAVGTTVTATLPSLTTLATLVSATGNPSQNGDQLTWSVGGIANGGSVSYTVQVRADATGSLTTSATASALNNDPKPANDSGSGTTVVS